VRAPERFETDRLVLRRPLAADAGEIFRRYASDPECTRYLSFPRHQEVTQTESFLALSDAAWARWPAGPYLIVSPEDGRLLGGTGLDFESPKRAATGYVLARDAWGRGIATETLAALVRLAPALGIERLYAHCHPDHAVSARVLRKCGFELEGTLRRHAEFPNLVPDALFDVLSFSRIFE
jgi:[ribosomal protein S5]-alanine N-acetyltransferase